MGAARLISAAIAFACASCPACAHHSFAMFDVDKTVPLAGTVKEFQWTNPHVWPELMVQDERGQTEESSLELGSPLQITSRGLKPKSFVPGDKVRVLIHPLKDGMDGGQFVAGTLADGTAIGEAPTYPGN